MQTFIYNSLEIPLLCHIILDFTRSINDRNTKSTKLLKSASKLSAQLRCKTAFLTILLLPVISNSERCSYHFQV